MIWSFKIFYDNLKVRNIDAKKILNQSKVFRANSQKLDFIESDSIDFVITSPPYSNVTDYIKGQRLSFHWLNLGDINDLKRNEIGASVVRHK